MMTTDEFNTILKSLALSRKDFAEITGVSYSTISQWRDDKNPIPSWVSSWLDNYKKAKALTDIIETVERVKDNV